MCACLPEMKEGWDTYVAQSQITRGQWQATLEDLEGASATNNMSALSSKGSETVNASVRSGGTNALALRYVTVSFPRGRQRPSFSPPFLHILSFRVAPDK